jgi:hypothetical protein
MEVIRVGETLLPSGRPIERLFLVSRPAEPHAPQMLVANDGLTVYGRQYPRQSSEKHRRSDAEAGQAGAPCSI